MKLIKLKKPLGTKFSLLGATRNAQAALMILAPGDSSDDELHNEHPRCEQWCFVVSGSGKITTAKPSARKRTTRLKANTLVAIERGERHQIVNDGDQALTTWNLYVPPAYDSHANPKPAAKR